MFVRAVPGGLLVEVDARPAGVHVRITCVDGDDPVDLTLHHDVAEALTEGLMLETVRDVR